MFCYTEKCLQIRHSHIVREKKRKATEMFKKMKKKLQIQIVVAVNISFSLYWFDCIHFFSFFFFGCYMCLMFMHISRECSNGRWFYFLYTIFSSFFFLHCVMEPKPTIRTTQNTQSQYVWKKQQEWIYIK